MVWAKAALLQAAIESEAALNSMAALYGYTNDIAATEQLPLPSPTTHPEPTPELSNGPRSPDLDPNQDLKPTQPAQLLLWRVTEIHQQPKSIQPAELSEGVLSAEEDERAHLRSYSFPMPDACRIESFVPLLMNSLGRQRVTKHIDVKRLLRQSAKGHLSAPLPRLRQTAWPQQLTIWVDKHQDELPYGQDYQKIVRWLANQVPNINVYYMVNHYQSLQSWYQHGVEQQPACQQWQPWQKPQTPLLILSNFHKPMQTQRYLAMRTHISSDYPVLTLSPAAQSISDEDFCRQLRPHAMGSALQPKRQPSRLGFGQGATGAGQQHNPSADAQNQQHLNQLLTMLAPLPIIDMGIIRVLRQAFRLGDLATDAAIWHHPHLEGTMPGKRLVAQFKQRYIQKFKELCEPHKDKFWQLLQRHHKWAYQGLRHTENLCVLLLIKEDKRNGEMKKSLQEASVYFERQMRQSQEVTKDNAGEPPELNQLRTVTALLPDIDIELNQQDSRLLHNLFGYAWRQQLSDNHWPATPPVWLQANALQWTAQQQPEDSANMLRLVQTSSLGRLQIDHLKAHQTQTQTPKKPNTLASEKHGSSPQRLAANNALIEVGDKKSFPASLQVAGVKSRQIWLHDCSAVNALLPTQPNGVVWVQEHGSKQKMQALHRPEWAHCIGYDKGQLFMQVSPNAPQYFYLPAFMDETQTYPEAWYYQPWKERTKILAVLPQRDAFGIYFDFTLNTVTQRFRWINPGHFMMGSPANEPERDDDETQHPVTLSQGYWLADTACSQALWRGVMGKNLSEFNSDPQDPVDSVSWDDCQQWIDKANSLMRGGERGREQGEEQSQDLQLTLPTEAQWEYACRAGTRTAFWWGSELTTEQANYDGHFPYNNGAKGEDRHTTVPVKSFTPNPWGLYQMHGNVWEWCQDRYQHQHGPMSEESMKNPKGPKNGADRVLRGGCWVSFGRRLRCAYRSRRPPDGRVHGSGLRLAIGFGQEKV